MSVYVSDGDVEKALGKCGPEGEGVSPRSRRWGRAGGDPGVGEATEACG